jgi:hypothetical protein
LTDAMQEWLDLLKSSSLEQVLELLVDVGQLAVFQGGASRTGTSDEHI